MTNPSGRGTSRSLMGWTRAGAVGVVGVALIVAGCSRGMMDSEKAMNDPKPMEQDKMADQEMPKDATMDKQMMDKQMMDDKGMEKK